MSQFQTSRPNPEESRPQQTEATTTASRVETTARPTVPQSENSIFSPQISLFNHSKDSLARMNMYANESYCYSLLKIFREVKNTGIRMYAPNTIPYY